MGEVEMQLEFQLQEKAETRLTAMLILSTLFKRKDYPKISYLFTALYFSFFFFFKKINKYTKKLS